MSEQRYPGSSYENTDKLSTHHSVPVDRQSQRSHVSRASSGQSITSSELARKRAKAQAARTKAEFAFKEADLKKKHAILHEKEQLSTANSVRKKTELEAELDLLNTQKEAAIAEAEIEALESICGDFSQSNVGNYRPHIALPSEDSGRRTGRYVLEHSKPEPVINVQSTNEHSNNFAPQSIPNQNTFNHNYNVEAPIFVPATINNNPKQTPPPPDITKDPYPVSDLTRFLLKKELLLSRLIVYNDLPESYAVWKASFSSIMSDLQVSPSEEMDLLVKYLGHESSRYASSLRAASINYPQRGLCRIWERLDERYGSPELVEAALMAKLNNFPKLSNKDYKKLYDLADILSEIEATKEDIKFKCILSYFDSSSGVSPIVSKLPYNIQEKWTNSASHYKRQQGVTYPPFSYFVEFIRDVSKVRNDPSFVYQSQQSDKPPLNRSNNRSNMTITARKTDINSENKCYNVSSTCPVHNTRHSLNQCRGFRGKPIDARKDFLRENKICFRCCSSTSHMAKDCTEKILCTVCDSTSHSSALHPKFRNYKPEIRSSHRENGGEGSKDNQNIPVLTKCTQICGNSFVGKSCSKTVLVQVFPKNEPNKAQKMYAIVDDQSNTSLAKSDFFELFDVHGELVSYSLSSCAGIVNTSGRRANGFIIQDLEGRTQLELPTLIECNDIPDNTHEIPTPEVALHHPHLNDIATFIPTLDKAPILLLIGRDLIEAHHVLEQRTGPRNSPYGQRLPLGWVIVGESCLGKIHKPDIVCVNKTYLLPNGRPSVFQACPNNFNVKQNHLWFPNEIDSSPIFQTTPDDNKVSLSIEDKQFLKIMDNDFVKNSNGDWVAPLPFKTPRSRLPNNRSQCVNRALTLDRSFKKNPTKREHFVTFMQKVLDNNHAEVAPPLTSGEECWYLPLFGVYHPHKPNQIRGVFDASAQYGGISLNNVLLQGPDTVNSLLGILIRFRKEAIAVTADIEQMFYCFKVRDDHRNFLRFLWYRNNDPDNDLIEYRMCVHVFGCTSSPAVATYGLRKTADIAQKEFGTDMKAFVCSNFYVDDGITSLPSAECATSLLQRTQQALSSNGNLRLHKITSNDLKVMCSFDTEDLAKELKDLDLGSDTLPTQKSLGLSWNLQNDAFTFTVSSTPKPYTRRGVLSTVSSLYDPIGFVAPVIVEGKLLLRTLIQETKDWDEPLDPDYKLEWESWVRSLKRLELLQIPRTYSTQSLQQADLCEIHVYCDASEKAIGAVAYLKTGRAQGQEIGFILGKAKVAPKHGNTIPRLELCAAVLAVEVAETVLDQIQLNPHVVQFHTDSRVVLGYINNTSRRFYVYVANRVERILRSTSPNQWNYVSTDLNPADQATRGLHSSDIQTSTWLNGPSHLIRESSITPSTEEAFPLTHPDNDKEVRPNVVTLDTNVQFRSLGSSRFERFSSWKSLVNCISLLKQFIKTSLSKQVMNFRQDLDSFNKAKILVLQTVQQDEFHLELSSLKAGNSVLKTSRLFNLDPVIDSQGLIKVGGRLDKSNLPDSEKHPIIIPSRTHIALLLVRHFHEEVKHQGRHFTEGALRAAGYWIVGAKRLISSVIHGCVKCRKLRGSQEHQKMADLPTARLEPAPPFTFVGVDTFGHWSIVTRRTRGGEANSKRWAVLFTCLCTRAVHIEIVEEMSASSFVNALRRFISIRGKVKEFRSDRGTNFIGSTDFLKIDAVNVEDNPVKSLLYNSGTKWLFNPPHSSHMGGVWERLIGVSRRILDSMMSEIAPKHLTHEVLVTLMAEVCAIINSRPIVPVSTDPESPTLLSPSTILTQKTNHVTTTTTEPLDLKDMYRAQWKRVQCLADTFWSRWKREYLQGLQTRRKWQTERPNLREGDLVLLKDKTLHRCDWPLAVIHSPIPSGDSKVRKAEVRLIRDGKPVIYVRPITDMVLLLSNNS